MRLIYADELKKVIFSKSDSMEDLWDTAGVLNAINNSPTVDITEEQAIDKLHETGWLPMHDKEMTERPTGEWEVIDVEGGKIFNCVCTECGHDPQEYIGGTENWWLRKPLPNFCPNCGVKIVNVKGAKE